MSRSSKNHSKMHCDNDRRSTSPCLRVPVSPGLFLITVAVFMFLPQLARAATIEFLTGAKVECKVLSKDDKQVVVEAEIGGKTVKKTYPLTSIHVVTINDKRYVINEKSDKAEKPEKPEAGESPSKSKPPTKKPGGKANADDSDDDSAVRRTKAEIDELINKVGRQPPDWFDATPLNYPSGLDLTWPQKPPGGWDSQKNVGQFIWDIINPNPGKWREGVKFMHHMLTLHTEDLDRRQRAMNSLAGMYYSLHEDWARAAFWWRQAGVEKGSGNANQIVHLAECYWRLGNKQMALDLLGKIKSFPAAAVKLYADMGDMTKAVQIADVYGKTPDSGAEFTYMFVADGYRKMGKTKEALVYYQKVVDMPAAGKNQGRIEKTQQRAKDSVEAIKLFELSDVSRVKDGTYQASSLGYEDQVQVSVTVAQGKITACKVTQHREKQFYSSLTDTPAKIIAKQGVKGVDTTSSATITSQAIISATAKALGSGAK